MAEDKTDAEKLSTLSRSSLVIAGAPRSSGLGRWMRIGIHEDVLKNQKARIVLSA
jgi:hypothetical protein